MTMLLWNRISHVLKRSYGKEGLENASSEIFEYIKTYYNPIQRHSALNYASPVTFEQKLSYPQKQEV